MTTLGPLVDRYVYQAISGQPLYRVNRHSNPKEFLQEHYDGTRWQWGLKPDYTPVPFRLPDVIVALGDLRTVFIVEGEKAVNYLWSVGLAATCNNGGAGKWGAAQSKYFAGADIVILPDNDERGRDHAAKVARALHEVGADRIRIVDLPGRPEKAGADDWLQAGNAVDELWNLAAAAPDYVYEPAQERQRPALVKPENAIAEDRDKAREEISRRVDCFEYMCRIAGEPKQKIRDGGKWLAPNRAERTASFTVYDGNRGFYDFGAGSGGDVFDLDILLNGGNFADALRRLADYANVTLPRYELAQDSGLLAGIPILTSEPESGKPVAIGLPITWRAAFNAHIYPAIGSVVEFWKEAIDNGLADPDEPLCAADLLDLGTTTGRNVSESTIRRGLKQGAGQFLAVCVHPIPDHDKTLSYSNQTARNITAGRKTTYYKLRSDDEIRTELAEQGIDRLSDKYFHRDDPIVAPVHADILKALGLSHNAAAAMVEQLTANGYADVIAAQPGLAERIAEYRQACDQYLFSLRDMTTAPIPVGWQYRNAAEYAACCARAISQAAGGKTRLGKPQWSKLLGKSKGSIKRILNAAAINDRPVEPEAKRITSAASLPRNFTFWHKAIVVTDGNKKTSRGLFQADRAQVAEFVDTQIAAGCTVDLMVQGANIQTIGSDVQPIKAPRQRAEITKDLDTPCAASDPMYHHAKLHATWLILNTLIQIAALPADESPRQPVKPYFGRGFNPDNWRDWPGKVLALKGWKFDGKELVNPDGEIAEYDPLAALELLKPVTRVDNPAAYIAQLEHRLAQLLAKRGQEARII